MLYDNSRKDSNEAQKPEVKKKTKKKIDSFLTFNLKIALRYIMMDQGQHSLVFNFMTFRS